MIPIELEISYADGHWLIRDPMKGYLVVRDTFPHAVKAVAMMMMQRGCGVDHCDVVCVVHGSKVTSGDIGAMVEEAGKPNSRP